MVYETIVLAPLALVIVGCGLGVVLVQDIWYFAFPLGGVLLSVTVHHVTLQAEFLAIMQVLVYVGGVLILITFAATLTHINPEVNSI